MTAEAAAGGRAGDFVRHGAVPELRRAFDPVDLFLFSAATWNPHRVHYDERYTVHSAGQSGLLVQGPLQAAVMFQLLRDALADGVGMESLSYRHQAALHAGEPARLAGRLSSVTAGTAAVDMWVESLSSGVRTTTGTATLRRPTTQPGPAGLGDDR